MSDNDSLLPPNATPHETALALSIARISDVPVDLEALRVPVRMPAALLPWIAYGLAVPEWDPDWPDAQKRAVIIDAIPTHQIKGTRGAVEAALATVGVPVTITEWWQQAPEGQRGTFKVEVRLDAPALDGQPVFTSARYRQIRRLVDRTKRMSQHYTFELGSTQTTAAGMAVAGRVWRHIKVEGIV